MIIIIVRNTMIILPTRAAIEQAPNPRLRTLKRKRRKYFRCLCPQWWYTGTVSWLIIFWSSSPLPSQSLSSWYLVGKSSVEKIYAVPYAEVMASFPSMERATSQELWGNDASVLEIDQVNCAKLIYSPLKIFTPKNIHPWKIFIPEIYSSLKNIHPKKKIWSWKIFTP